MQTFLPYPSFIESMKVLDNKRLGKQRIEATVILRTLNKIKIKNGWKKIDPNHKLSNEKIPWENHPAIKMWTDYVYALRHYQTCAIHEWMLRGYKNTITPSLGYRLNQNDDYEKPWWLGNEEFHSAHRSKLFYKNPEFYNQFNWEESKQPEKPYFWPGGKP